MQSLIYPFRLVSHSANQVEVQPAGFSWVSSVPVGKWRDSTFSQSVSYLINLVHFPPLRLIKPKTRIAVLHRSYSFHSIQSILLYAEWNKLLSAF
jgi:hypothetical protein